jgi:hypothetical protein
MTDFLTEADKTALKSLGYEEYKGRFGYNDDVTKQDYQVLAITQEGKIVVKNLYTNEVDAIERGIYTKCSLSPDVPDDIVITRPELNLKIAPLVGDMPWTENEEPFKVSFTVDHQTGKNIKKMMKYLSGYPNITLSKK